MNKTALQALLSERVIAFNPVFAHIAGDVKSGLFLSQCSFLSLNHGDDDGWFYSTDAQWEEATLMGRYEITRARKVLNKLGILYFKVKGQAHKTYYRIDWQKLESLIILHNEKRSKNAQMQETHNCESRQVKKQATESADVKNSHSQMRETHSRRCEKVTSANVRNSHTKREYKKELKKNINNSFSVEKEAPPLPVDNFSQESEGRRQYELEKAKLFKQTGLGRKKTGVEAALGG